MRLLQPLVFAGIVAGSIGTAHAADPYVLDQRDPRYQQAIENISVAAQALSVAKAALAEANAAYPLPGINLAAMQRELVPLEETLQVVLSPEKKRLAHQTVVPDGIFFTPVNKGD